MMMIQTTTSRVGRIVVAGLATLTLTAAAPASDSTALRRTVEKLVSFGTRHTLSTTTDPKRGIGAARNWVAAEFTKLGKACGGCITIDRPSQRFTGPRAPQGVVVEDVLGIQRGTGDPNHIVIVAGHIDSRVTDAMNATNSTGSTIANI